MTVTACIHMENDTHVSASTHDKYAILTIGAYGSNIFINNKAQADAMLAAITEISNKFNGVEE